MSAPKDPEKRKIWIENIRKVRLGTHLSEKTKEKLKKAFPKGKHPNCKQRIKKICPVCGINFNVIPSQKHRESCSIECKDKLKSERQKGEKNYFYGKKHSKETKDKLSKVAMGKYSGENNPMFGKKRPDVTKRLKQQVGEKHPNFGKRGKETSQWLGGISFEPYTIEFNKQLKELIRSRDGYRCQKCGCSEIEAGQKLGIHHIDYCKKNCLSFNLIALCRRCNAIVNTNRKKWTCYFQKKLGTKQKQNQLCLSIS